MIVRQGPTALAVGGGGLDIFFSILSPSLWETARYRLKYCLKGPLNPKQSTNQIHNLKHQNAGFVDVKMDLNSKRSKGIFVRENLKNKQSY